MKLKEGERYIHITQDMLDRGIVKLPKGEVRNLYSTDIKRTSCNCSIPKGMRLIGTCKTCKDYIDYCIKGVLIPTTIKRKDFGCRYWRMK